MVAQTSLKSIQDLLSLGFILGYFNRIKRSVLTLVDEFGFGRGKPGAFGQSFLICRIFTFKPGIYL